MYNITYGWRPTDRRPEAETGGRAAGRPSDACARGTGEARGNRVVGGATEVRGRVGLVDVVTPRVGAPSTASHERGAGVLRSGFCGVRFQASAPQAAPTVRSDSGPDSERNQETKTTNALD